MKRIVMVEKCVCHDVPFTVVAAFAAARQDTSLNDIRVAFGCGGSCGMCRRYMQQVLATGETSIPLMLPSSGDAS
jgi:bacterioferritin-associated ferredoxin